MATAFHELTIVAHGQLVRFPTAMILQTDCNYIPFAAIETRNAAFAPLVRVKDETAVQFSSRVSNRYNDAVSKGRNEVNDPLDKPLADKAFHQGDQMRA